MKTVRPILLAIAIALIAFAIYRRAFHEKKATNSPGSVELEVRSIPVTHNLALGDFEVPARATHDVKIAFDESGSNARVSGEFAAVEGPGIQVMLLDENQYRRVQQHQPPSVFLYLSKVAAKGNIEADLPRTGTYYLVFDNSSSQSSTKVHADVAIHYQMMRVDSQRDQKR